MRGSIILLALLALVNLTGCRMCGNDNDCSYSASGGLWKRTNQNSGRVGSIFAPAGVKVGQGMKSSPQSAEPWTNQRSGDDQLQEDPPTKDPRSKSVLDDLEFDVEDEPTELAPMPLSLNNP